MRITRQAAALRLHRLRVLHVRCILAARTQPHTPHPTPPKLTFIFRTSSSIAGFTAHPGHMNGTVRFTTCSQQPPLTPGEASSPHIDTGMRTSARRSRGRYMKRIFSTESDELLMWTALGCGGVAGWGWGWVGWGEVL